MQYGYLGTTLKCMDKNPAGSVEKLAYCLANGMFDASRLQNLEQQLGIKFKVDCCASNSGSSSLCPEYYSPSKSFLKSSVSELAGKPLWINPPFHGLANFLKKYTKLKKQSPDVISACILVPKKSGKWKKFLRGMNKVLTLEADSFMYRDPDTHQSLGPHPWTMEVWYDSPKLPVSALRADMMNFHDDAKPLSMLFGGTLENKPANFLVDTGASHNFVDRSFAMKHKLTWLGESGEVNCGGRHTAQISGTLETYAKVQGFASSQKFYVTDLPFSVDCIFGQTWLEDHKALVDYDKRVVRFRIRGQQRGYLRCLEDGEGLPQPPSRGQPLLSSMQFKKMVKDGNPAFLVTVTATENGGISIVEDAVPILEEFKDVFASMPSGLPPDRGGIGHTIPTGDSPPIAKPGFRLSAKERKEVEEQVAILLERKLIQPSQSPYGAPVLFVAKKDGGLRMCVDYRALNNVTVKDKFPIPRVDDLLDRLDGAKVFSSLDLQSGYHQIRIADGDVSKTAFRTHMGLFEYKVLPFGLSNAPAAFQREMQRLIGHLDFVLVYLDDILIFSRDPAEHAKHLRTVLELLRTHKLYAKMSKCSFFKDELPFLGYVVGKNGVAMDSAKVKTIMDWPEPSSPKDLKSFLGLCNYFKRFIQGYSLLVAPLTRLTSTSVVFGFGQAERAAFLELKKCLTSAPVLALPNPTQPFEVVCDASGFGAGAVLLQNGRPVAFHSYKFNSAECNYSPGEQELLAVIKALERWRCYLEGAEGGVTVVTDHQPNTFLHTKPAVQLSRRQTHWMEFLSRFDFVWEYRKGACNVADPISRNPALLLGMIQPGQLPEPAKLLRLIKDSYTLDSWFSDGNNTHNLNLEGGLWTLNGVIVVPDVEDLRQLCIQLHHDVPSAGHQGQKRTLELMQRSYWWPTIRMDVTKYVETCDACQRSKASNQRPAGLLKPLDIPQRRWESVSMDLITQLPLTDRGHTAIIVFVDRLSKMVHFVAAHTDMGSEEFAQVFLREVFAKHGLPKNIVSDRDTRFTSKFFKELCRHLGVKQHMSTAFHPQSDGQTERANRVLEDMLRTYVAPSQDDWDLKLPCCEFAVNNAWNAATGSTPFFLNFGEHPRSPVDMDVSSDVPAVMEYADKIGDALRAAKERLKVAQDRMKAVADGKRRDESFQVGDMVLLKTTHINLAKLGTKKLYPLFIGPFKIVDKINEVAYKLDLPMELKKVHPTFHVSLLRRYKDDGLSALTKPPPLMVEGNEEYEVERILTHKDLRNGTRQYLVRWVGYGPESDTYFNESKLTHCRETVQKYLDTLLPEQGSGLRQAAMKAS